MGKALIITNADFSAYAKGIVTILKQVPVSGISIIGATHGKVGETIHLSVAFVPNDTIFRQVEWSVDDSSKAVISQNGDLLLNGEGVVTVTATSVNFPSISATLQVSITGADALIIETAIIGLRGYIDKDSGNSHPNDKTIYPGRLDISIFEDFTTQIFDSSLLTSAAGYAFYTGLPTSTFISGGRGQGMVGANADISFTAQDIPENAVYFATTYFGAAGDSIPFSGRVKSSLTATVMVADEGGTSESYISGISGDAIHISSQDYPCTASGWLPIRQGAVRVHIPLYAPKDAEFPAGYAFYDTNKNFISGDHPISGDTAPRITWIAVNIPAGAAYIRCTFCTYGFNFIMF